MSEWSSDKGYRMKAIGRVLWAVIEYLWYPVFLTTGIWVLIKSGFFDDVAHKAMGGFLIIGFVLWKLAQMLARVDWRTRTQLLVSFCWMVAYISYVASYHPDWMDLRPKKQVWVAMMPLMFFVKMVINREAVAPEWVVRWINRRKAQRASAGLSED
jgi:hypothetical protein